MITISITGTDIQKLIASAKSLEKKILLAMVVGLDRALQFAVGQAGSTFMSGPTKTMLGVRTGRLRSALAHEVAVDGDRIIGRIGDNMPYAAKWEFGFHGIENVRAHTRIVGWTGKKGELPTYKTRFQFGKGGVKGGILLGSFKQDIRPAEVRAGLSNFKSIVQVRAHQRRINLDPRPFLRPALEATDIAGEINSAVKEVQA